MEHCLSVARSTGLTNAHWSGVPELPGRVLSPDPGISSHYRSPSAHLGGTYAARAGCVTHPRGCTRVGIETRRTQV